MTSSADFSTIADALRPLRLGVSASDLHGSLTGYLCAGAQAGADDWPAALHLEFDAPDAAAAEALRRLYRLCRAQFEGPRADVDPLLPSRAEPLARRADALVEWCRGFLGGFGLAGVTERTALPADASEILADFGTIAASRFDYADNAEDEQALTDVIDFVRIGTALLHREVHESRRASARMLH
jgi:uncharacterized protein YgfB (UPF0149 family)